ncbi:hypothetical protein QTJ16_006615 [Diplocarpon rosae]|uniref:lytic cellulose monooxygenase (C4-dehydrogenating) n=1 Tax=Diplocarpon rosae TaxID=946125 RepID=A0AAD9SUR5_9HELO|nr:hypothetical protein QTJ16_006615 [Diplocarpon rosae]
MSFPTFFSLLAALAATVSAHGYVDNATIGGTLYSGYQINSDPYSNPIPERIFRPVSGNGPVDDVTLIDLQCGGYTAGGIVGSKPAKLTAGPVAAGTDVEIRWTLWPDTHMGPVITYLAACPGNDCTTFEPNTDAVWFKIQEAGRVGTTNEWASTPLTKPGAAVTYTIPECLAPGAYLVRHEILALHTAFAYPGAQFYPSCHQIEVTGSGSSTGPATKVAFPGAYKPEDPGITYDATKATEYIIPGPELFVCGGSTGATTPSTPYTPAGNDTQPPVYNGSPPTTPTTPATPSTPTGDDTQPPVYNGSPPTTPTTPATPSTPTGDDPQPPVYNGSPPTTTVRAAATPVVPPAGVPTETPVEDDDCY